MADEFRTGEHYPGFGIFGSGTYADATRGSRNAATNQYGASGSVIRMALPRTAKIIKQSELERKVPHSPANATHGGGGNGSQHKDWRGVQAALAGYDAIHIDGHSASHGSYGNPSHSDTEGFYVILNRSILTVQRQDAKGHVIS